MGYNIGQIDIRLLKQLKKFIYIKIDLLNYQMKTVDSIEGKLTNDSYNIDATSDIRRTITLDMIVKGKIFTYTRNSAFWLDKYLKTYVGYQHDRDKTIYWYPLGIYMISDSGFDFDATTSTLSLSCVDLMAKFTGLRGGVLQGTQTKVPLGNNVRQVVIDTITQFGITKYRVEDPNLTVPYDIELGTGSTVYDLLCELRDLKPSWEFFFDIDGTFIFQPIPQCIEDENVLNDDILSQLVIKETLNRKDSEVKNHIIVYGASIKADKYATTVTNTNETYNCTVDSFTAYTGSQTLCLKANITNLANPKVNVNSLGSKAIMNTVNGTDVTLQAGKMLANTYYVVKYDSSKGYFYYQGQFQIQGEAKDTNSSSPFYINGTIGDIVDVKSGGEYEKISTDQLALERAEYELWKSTRFNETVSLEIIAIPWLDVNKKIGHVSLNTGEDMPLITKKISGSMSSGKQSVECIHWYPLYPFSTT